MDREEKFDSSNHLRSIAASFPIEAQHLDFGKVLIIGLRTKQKSYKGTMYQIETDDKSPMWVRDYTIKYDPPKLSSMQIGNSIAVNAIAAIDALAKLPKTTLESIYDDGALNSLGKIMCNDILFELKLHVIPAKQYK